MICVLLVSTEKNSLADLKSVFEENGTRVKWAESCDTVLSMIKNEKFDLIITNETLSYISGIECIEKLILSDPFLNTAAVSSLSPDEFHELSEGLGILMQLPPRKRRRLKAVVSHQCHLKRLRITKSPSNICKII